MNTAHEASKAVSEAHPAVPVAALMRRNTHTHPSGHTLTTSPFILAFSREENV